MKYYKQELANCIAAKVGNSDEQRQQLVEDQRILDSIDIERIVQPLYLLYVAKASQLEAEEAVELAEAQLSQSRCVLQETVQEPTVATRSSEVGGIVAKSGNTLLLVN